MGKLHSPPGLERHEPLPSCRTGLECGVVWFVPVDVPYLGYNDSPVWGA
jgi:hypothetical protein